jgi:GH15 family glucan-1,4-alpha-glucosidase
VRDESLARRKRFGAARQGGSIDWLCFPRFGSPSTYGRLLEEKAGHWFFGVTNATAVSRRYLGRTMVLETTLRTTSGSVTITDALAMDSGNRGHELGKGVLTFSSGAPRADLSREYGPALRLWVETSIARRRRRRNDGVGER